MGIDKEEMQEIMYAVMSELSKSKHKIVFKGSLLLSALMEGADILSPSRLSRDADGDVQNVVSLNEMQAEVERVLYKVGLKTAVLQIDDRTTGDQFFFKVFDTEGQGMFSIDLGVRINPWHTVYELKSGVQICGQTIAKIFWDKICVVSSPDVNQRPWDVFDMYLLSLRNDLRMSDILAVKKGTGRLLGNFETFLTPSEKLRSTWKRRRYIKDRPEFNAMFGRVRDLCTPFITEWEGKAEWNPSEGLWYEGESKL